ncbi:MAG: VWA domain-containing protein, partial [Albidovulum sp.]
LVMMMFLAGAALDLMRYEERRTTLQNTVDRAVLAAADLRQTLPPKEVVKDYFRKAGLKPPSDSDIVVNQGTFNEWRTVQANVSEVMPTWFMRMVDIQTMTPIGSGTAEERVGQVEISLVLDVSGSMNSNNRLTNLKPAARAFIDQMFATVEPGKLSISLITYSTQVSAGPELLQYFDVTNEHNDSSCLEFNSGDFNTTTMSPSGSGRTYKRNGHFDPFYRTSNIDSSGLWNCPKDANEAYRHILAYSGSRTALKNAINALQAEGNTSIDLGVKWGAGLLDPSMAPVVQAMIASGDAPAAFSDRPYAYNDNEALKVIVVMTDGVNTTEYKLDSDYDHGDSQIWKTSSYSGLDQYSFYDPNRTSSSKYYSMRTDSWRTAPYGSNPQRMTWPEVWEAMSLRYVADYIIYPIYGSTERNRWRAGYSSSKTSSYVSSQKNSQTLAACSAAKAHKNVKIFTIGFEAPSAARTLLKSCASSQAHYYDAAGVDITTAFSSIASSINKLRLTH